MCVSPPACRSVVYQQSSKESATLQPFFTLQLDIQSEKIRTVQEALETLVARESVQGYTTKTKQEVRTSVAIPMERRIWPLVFISYMLLINWCLKRSVCPSDSQKLENTCTTIPRLVHMNASVAASTTPSPAIYNRLEMLTVSTWPEISWDPRHDYCLHLCLLVIVNVRAYPVCASSCMSSKCTVPKEDHSVHWQHVFRQCLCSRSFFHFILN